MLLIDELLWNRSDRDLFSLQRNSDSDAVVRFTSITRMKSHIEEAGMQLIWEGAFGIGHKDYAFPDTSNLPRALAVAHAKSLIFDLLPK